MTEAQLEKIVLAYPVIQGMAGSPESKKETIRAFLPVVLDEIIMSFGWDFATDEADATSVAEQAEYVLKGNKGDCRAIVNVKFGSTPTLIDRMSQVDMDELLVGRTITTVQYWVDDGITQGFPQIKLVDAPDTANLTIRYRYWKKNIGLSEFPNEWGGVVASAVVKEMAPEYWPIYQSKLNDMKDKYRPSGGEDNPAKLDPHIVARNNTKDRLYGWGG